MKYILELEDEPNKEYFGEGNYYRCKQIPYWSISESMRNRLEPYDEADRKTENSSEKPNSCEHITEDGVTCAKYPACDDCLDNPLNKVKGSERLVKSSEQTEPTISKMEQVDKDINVRSKDEPQTKEPKTILEELLERQTKEDIRNMKERLRKAVEGEPQTDTEIAKEIVHTMINDAVIAEDAYPDLRQKMHDAVDEYEPKDEPQTERRE